METAIMVRDTQPQVMAVVSTEAEKAAQTMQHDKMLQGEGGGVDSTGIMDDEGGIMQDIDGEYLLFSDDMTFPSLPDFPCLSSPPVTPSAASTIVHAKKTLLSCASSSSSSASASWPFFQVPDAGAAGCCAGDMQQQPVALPSEIDEIMMLTQPSLSLTSNHNHQTAKGDGGAFSELGLDILSDIDLLDVPPDPWDPCSTFPSEGNNIVAVDEGDAGKPGSFLGEGRFGEWMVDKIDALQHQQREEEVEDNSSSNDLAKVFLDWLKNNKDLISLEDLRSIKLKRSTIECAARRLGGEKEGKTQLLKLILAWVQNNYFRGKRRRGRPLLSEEASPLSYHNQQQQYHPFPDNSSLNHFDYNYGGADAAGVDSSSSNLAHHWISYSIEPSNRAIMTAYGGNGEMMYPAAVASYPYRCTTPQFSSSFPDFHSSDHGVGPWTSQFTASAPSFAPFLGAASCHAPMSMATPSCPGSFPIQFPDSHPMFQQGQRSPGTASATKEARKKRMARQRRFSSPHHQRGQNQHQLSQTHKPASELGGAGALAAAGATDAVNPSNWALWTNMSPSSSHQMNLMTNIMPSPLLPPALHLQQQQHNTLRNAAASASHSEKLEGWKNTEKNLKFLLQKVLKQSDVGSLGRIVLPKKEAEIHLPELDARDGISIEMEDIGTSRVWNMRYRYWPNNKSRMYLLENTGDFVRSNGLGEGDFIVIYLDLKCGKYMIRGVKVHHQVEARRATTFLNAGRAQKKRSCSERTYNLPERRESSEEGDDEDEDYEEASPSSMEKMDPSPRKKS